MILLFDVLFRYVTSAFVIFKSEYELTVLNIYHKMSLEYYLFNDVEIETVRIGAH